MTDPAQSARFLEMAKSLEADESGESFHDAFAAITGKTPGRLNRESKGQSDVISRKSAIRRARKGEK